MRTRKNSSEARRAPDEAAPPVEEAIESRTSRRKRETRERLRSTLPSA